MPYNESLASRVKNILKKHKSVDAIKMFGGLCFTLRGNMCCGVLNDDLILRVNKNDHDQIASKTHVRVMDFTGRPMRGFFYIHAHGTKTDAALKKWLDLAIKHAQALPPKFR